MERERARAVACARQVTGASSPCLSGDFNCHGQGDTQPTELLFHEIEIRAGSHEPRYSLDQETGTHSMQTLNLTAPQGNQNIRIMSNVGLRLVQGLCTPGPWQRADPLHSTLNCS